jgi:hypothetical protein
MKHVFEAITRQRNFVEAMERADSALNGKDWIMPKLCYDEIVRDKNGRVLPHPLAMDSRFSPDRGFSHTKRHARDEEEVCPACGKPLDDEDDEQDEMENAQRYGNREDVNRVLASSDRGRRRRRGSDDLDFGPQAAKGSQGMGRPNPPQIPWLEEQGEDKRGRAMDSATDDFFGARRIKVM